MLLLSCCAMVLRLSQGVAEKTFMVNNTDDRVDAVTGNGVSRTATKICLLRAVIEEAALA